MWRLWASNARWLHQSMDLVFEGTRGYWHDNRCRPGPSCTHWLRSYRGVPAIHRDSWAPQTFSAHTRPGDPGRSVETVRVLRQQHHAHPIGTSTSRSPASTLQTRSVMTRGRLRALKRSSFDGVRKFRLEHFARAAACVSRFGFGSPHDPGRELSQLFCGACSCPGWSSTTTPSSPSMRASH